MTKLTDAELVSILRMISDSGLPTYADALKSTLDDLAAELSQAQAELAGLRAGATAVGDAWLVPPECFDHAKMHEAVCAIDARALGIAAPQPPAQPVAVRVKPLVWREVSGNGYAIDWRGASKYGQIFVVRAVNKGDMIKANGRYHLTVDEGKADCQAEFNHRILSAIDARPEAAVKAEALREVANTLDALAVGHANPDTGVGYQEAAFVCRTEADRLEKEGN